MDASDDSSSSATTRYLLRSGQCRRSEYADLCLYIYIIFLIPTVLAFLARFYYEQCRSPCCQKAFDEAEAAAREAVLGGNAVPFQVDHLSHQISTEGTGSDKNYNREQEGSYVAVEDAHNGPAKVMDGDADVETGSPITLLSTIQPRSKDADKGNSDTSGIFLTVVPANQPFSPISGQYEGIIAALPGYDLEPQKSKLNLQFIPPSTGGGTIYGISGGGKHLQGGFCDHRYARRYAESRIVSGFYNKRTGLATWQEIVDHDRACELDKNNPLYVERIHTQDDGAQRPWNAVVTYMTVLTHGKFDSACCNFHGWYYAQMRSGNDYHNEEKGAYSSFRLVSAALPTDRQ